MTLLIATPKATDANAYLTVAQAAAILRKRLHTTAWDDASSTPNAEGYLASAGASAGASTVAVDTGSGTFTVGTVVTFGVDTTEYTVQTALAAAGDLSISPVLAADVGAGAAVVRHTASERERAVLWATRLLDDLVAWYGAPRTTDQALRWPRSGVYNADGEAYDYDTVPEIVQEATTELALWLLDGDKFAQPSLLGQGFSEAKVGPLFVKVDDAQVVEVIPENVLALVAHVGELKPAAQKGTRVVPLERT